MARWLAPAQPLLALELLQQPDFGLDLDTLDAATRAALIAGAQSKANTLDPVERAAAYRALSLLKADQRPGIGLRPDGLPDIDWVTIPAGEFIYQDEKQPRSLPAFQISRYPITYAQFQAFIDAPDGWRNPQWWEGLAASDGHKAQPEEQYFKFSNHPRENVSWYDAIAFCRWLTAALTPGPSPSGRGENDTARIREMAAQVIVTLARELRKGQTNAEERLWECLRDRRLNGLKFRRQHPVANTAYIVDFFCYDLALVIEVDGGIHRDQQAADAARQRDLEALGLRVLRFSNEQVFNQLESVLITVLSAATLPFSLREKGPGDEGMIIRLPTEQEWEKAARGTDGRRYPYGNDFDAAKGNTSATGIGQTSAVGLFADGASPDGVLDMSGNVWEWCLGPHENPPDRAEDTDLRSSAGRVLRGGSWYDHQNRARAAYRLNYDPTARYNNVGFRLLRLPF